MTTVSPYILNHIRKQFNKVLVANLAKRYGPDSYHRFLESTNSELKKVIGLPREDWDIRHYSMACSYLSFIHKYEMGQVWGR